MKKKILIVEDEEAFRKSLAKELALSHLTVLEAMDGVIGEQIALKEHPDIILVDIVLPKLDGINMIKDIRKDEWGKTAKIILLTQLDFNQKVSEAMELGVFDYLIKSDHSLEDIVRLVKEKVG